MKRPDNKSSCPINFTVEAFGDTWSLLIIRDIAALGKRTFGEFLESEERIGPSVLADRLAHLEAKGVITKKTDAADKRRVIYSLTESGMSVLPIVYEYATWGVASCADPDDPDPWSNSLQHNKALVLRLWHEALESGSSFFFGPNSVATKLKLF
jgi:DNA-binding HxlR family transcriptional regulator